MATTSVIETVHTALYHANASRQQKKTHEMKCKTPELHIMHLSVFTSIPSSSWNPSSLQEQADRQFMTLHCHVNIGRKELEKTKMNQMALVERYTYAYPCSLR